jgi:hypothetical protein
MALPIKVTINVSTPKESAESALKQAEEKIKEEMGIKPAFSIDTTGGFVMTSDIYPNNAKERIINDYLRMQDRISDERAKREDAGNPSLKERFLTWLKK